VARKTSSRPRINGTSRVHDSLAGPQNVSNWELQGRQGDIERVTSAGNPEQFSPGVAPKVNGEVTADVVMLALRSIFNPLRCLTPQLLSTYLDQRVLGYVAYAALVWEQIERRDDVIRNVASKRKKAASRLLRQSRKLVNTPEAEEDARALDDFYNNITVVNALDQNEVGGFPLLVRQMMDAVGKYYAVHEIVWQPGEVLTAELRFVPLWFFENRSGRLQFLKLPFGGADGIPLDPGGWMITKGDGIMEACSIAYMFKNMSLKDWVCYSDKFGTPGVLGRTNAAQGSQAGQSLMTAVSQFGNNWSGVIYGDDGTVKEPLSLVQARGEGVLPFPPLVERMDRTLMSLWRGEDLSTMSADKKGASIQGDEADILLDDDAATIRETLNMYLDRWIIWQKFGRSPSALSELVVPKTLNVQNEMLVLRTLLEAGSQIGMKATMDRFAIPMIREDDVPLRNPAEIIQRITDSETGIVDPTEPPGTPVGLQKPSSPKQKANASMSLVNALLPDRSGIHVAHHEWLEQRMKKIAEAGPADIANEIALSIKSLQSWANSVYPENRPAAVALEDAVLKTLFSNTNE